MEDAPVFRPSIRAPPQGQADQLLGSAGSFVQELPRTLCPSKNPADEEALLALCEKDVARGFASGFLTKEALDCKYGEGQWRPLPRFPVYQAHNGKYRAIDDGRRSGHNLATEAWTTSHDMVVAIASAFHRQLGEMSCKKVWMMSLQHTASSQLQMPARTFSLLPSITASGSRCFFFKCTFGLSSSVLNYNRGPELQFAAVRQLLDIPCLHFYDDNLCFGLSREYGSAQQRTCLSWRKASSRMLFTRPGLGST